MALPGPFPFIDTVGLIVRGITEVSKIVDNLSDKSNSTEVDTVQPAQPVVIHEPAARPVEVIDREPVQVNLNVNIYLNGEKVDFPKIESSADGRRFTIDI